MLLILKTPIRCIALPFVLFLLWAPAASAWSWPVQGPVLQPFSYDEAHAYAAGQHRGIDIGADAAGETVVAPAAGTVSFAGTVPTNGQSVTITTADGYSVTLTHLGSILVSKGASVAEQDPVGTIGPSGTPEASGPYVHLGIRVTTDPNGYVDPLGLLPPAAESGVTETETGSTASQPSSSGASASPPVSRPAHSSPAKPSVSTRGSAVAAHTSQSAAHEHERVQESRADVNASRVSQSPASHAAVPRRRVSKPTSASQRPVVEKAAPVEPAVLDTGHEPQTNKGPIEIERLRPQASSPAPALAFNGAAALVALGAALATGRRRRRREGTGPMATGQVLRLPQPAVEQRRAA